jgi:hypothetical protein
MTESRRVQTLLTPDEYLEIEESASIRHEYVMGSLFSKGGSTRTHNVLTQNVGMPLHLAAGGTTSQVFLIDFKLRISDDIFYYPDVMVVSDPADNHE